MLFTENANRNLWQKIVDTTNSNPDILPIIYYRPFKAARFYLKSRFTGKDAIANIQDFEDKQWHAERYFNVYKLEEYIE
jgi:hypothetical protein